MRLLFIGGDMRMVYTAEKIGRLYEADTLGLGEEKKPSGKYQIIVLPMPLTKDGEHIISPLSCEEIPIDRAAEYAQEGTVVYSGGYSSRLWEICRKHNMVCENYLSRETLILKNAALTAEAAAGLLINSTSGSLLGSNALIIGFGRIAKELAKRLKAFGCNVTAAARNPADRALAELSGFSALSIGDIIIHLAEFDYVINTAPVQIFTDRHFAGMKEGGAFMELATLGAEPSCGLCGKFGLKYIPGGGLPGKYSPKTAGEFIAQEIMTDCGNKAEVPRKDSD